MKEVLSRLASLVILVVITIHLTLVWVSISDPDEVVTQVQPPEEGVIRTRMDLPEVKKTWNISAYCPCEKCCGAYSKGKHYRQTANGYMIQKGDKLIAAPKSIPFGTWVNVPGYGRAQVKDRGGAIKDNKLDLYFDTHQEALNWGRQHLQVSFN